MSIFLSIVVVLSALVLVLTVLFQSSNAKGLGAIAGEAETYFGKNKGKSIDAKLALGTKVAATVFVVACLLFVIFGYKAV